MPRPTSSAAAVAPTVDQLVLSILLKCRHLNHLKQLQSHLTVLGHSHTQFLTFKLVRFCILSLHNLPYARLIFDALPSPNVYLHTAMITAYASHPHHHPSALLLYRRMVRLRRAKPNHFIFPHLLKCSHNTRMLHTHVLKFGFSRYPVVGTALIDGYLRGGGDVRSGRKLFDEMSERSVVSWTAMITGYARVGEIGNGLVLFEEMPERDVPAWNAVVAGFAQNGFFLEAISFFRRMINVRECEIRPNHVTVVCVLSACGNLGMLHLGRGIHGYIYRNDIGLNSYITNALVDMYGKCGNLKEARRVFDNAPEKSLTLWNSMINCLALHGESEKAIGVFNEMMECGGSVKPDGVTFVGLLNACTHGGLVDQGYEYFKLLTRNYNIEPEIQHYGCVVDLLCRAGKFEEVMEVVGGMRIKPDEVIWGSLLNGSKIHGRSDLAEFAIKKLIDMDPTNAGYGIMLANIHGEGGNWDEVGKVRKVLKQQGVQKTPGCSWIEIDKQVRQFYSADTMHPESEEIYKILDTLLCSL